MKRSLWGCGTGSRRSGQLPSAGEKMLRSYSIALTAAARNRGSSVMADNSKSAQAIPAEPCENPARLTPEVERPVQRRLEPSGVAHFNSLSPHRTAAERTSCEGTQRKQLKS